MALPPDRLRGARAACSARGPWPLERITSPMTETRRICGAASAIALAGALGACASAPPPPTATLGAVELALASDPLHRHHQLVMEADPALEGGLRSRVVVDSAPFTEALPSWNVVSKEPFTVDIRVRLAGSNWSPWLRIGDWNLPGRTEDVPTTFERGRVAVDVLRLVSPMDEMQLAFRPADGAEALNPMEVSASVVLTNLERLESRIDATRSEPWPTPVRLAVPARSQREDGGAIGHRICSPTSVAMALSYHGVDVRTAELAAALRDPHHDIYGNWNRAVQGARTFGVHGRLARVSSWRSVAAVLATGTPIIASIRAGEGELHGAPYPSTAGHLLVITGLGADGAVHVNDPAARNAGSVPRTYSRSDMTRVWLANGGVCYLLEGVAPQFTTTSESP